MSFWTPPILRPRAIMIGKIVKEMVRQKIEPIIVTFDTCGKWDIDLPIYTISPFYSKKNILFKVPLIKNIQTNLREFLYYKQILRQVEKIIKKHKINVVFSFSNPQSSNILGAKIRKKLKIPFISYFSDPWSDNPYNKFSFLQNLKTKFLEKFVIRWSDKIGFTNNEALSLVMKKYPYRWQSKAVVIPHCFDSNDYPKKTELENTKFTISHTGAFYKKRTPEALFMAVRKMRDIEPLTLSKIKITLVGGTLGYTDYTENNLKELVKKYQLENVVETLPPVSYGESLKTMSNSDLLVVIDADLEKSPFLPSKVVDYAGSGTNIIGITPKGSPTTKFLQNAGFISFDYSEINKLESFLRETVNKKIEYNSNLGFLKNYRSDYVVKQLLVHMQYLVHNKKSNKRKGD